MGDPVLDFAPFGVPACTLCCWRYKERDNQPNPWLTLLQRQQTRQTGAHGNLYELLSTPTPDPAVGLCPCWALTAWGREAVSHPSGTNAWAGVSTGRII